MSVISGDSVIERGFAKIAEGQVHYRQAGAHHALKERPLVMIHASPGSAKTLEPLVAKLGVHRWVIALDTLGNGDSCAPKTSPIEMAYLAQAHLRALDALGVEVFHLYGTHTGANIAGEMAIAAPERVQGLILDGVSLYTERERQDFLEHYAPDVVIDHSGSQFQFMWGFMRDAYLFWPWYEKSAKNLRNTGLPSPDILHDKAVEVFKAARTYPFIYRAALAYDKTSRLPLIKNKTLLCCAKTDMLFEYFEKVSALMPHAKKLITQGTSSEENLRNTAAMFEDFLNQS